MRGYECQQPFARNHLDLRDKQVHPLRLSVNWRMINRQTESTFKCVLYLFKLDSEKIDWESKIVEERKKNDLDILRDHIFCERRVEITQYTSLYVFLLYTFLTASNGSKFVHSSFFTFLLISYILLLFSLYEIYTQVSIPIVILQIVKSCANELKSTTYTR